MDYTPQVFVNFINKLIALDKDCRSIIFAAEEVFPERSAAEQKEWSKTKQTAMQCSSSFVVNSKKISDDLLSQMDKSFETGVNAYRKQFDRLQKCKELLAEIEGARNSVESSYKSSGSEAVHIEFNIEQLIEGKIDFLSLSHQVNNPSGKLKAAAVQDQKEEFLQKCKAAEAMLNNEIMRIRSEISSSKDGLHVNYSGIFSKSNQRSAQSIANYQHDVDKMVGSFSKQYSESKSKTASEISSRLEGKIAHLQKLTKAFLTHFSPEDFAEEYATIYAKEPLYSDYQCCKDMPRNIRISTLEYDISALKLCPYTESFLNLYYPFMFKGSRLCIPNCTTFSKEFNYIFRFRGPERSNVVRNACDLGMRLFTMLPPGKLNFTFVDPVTLGESFAMFTRLVDIDDRTSEVINGKIWSSPNDIEDKLKIMTDHISNITQRCLQGKYENIYEYNRVAEQNAEAYQVLMLMDFPAGMTERSLKLLEQIVTSGPKCGVFTIIYRNESQYKKIQERSMPLISNIESSFQQFDFSADGSDILCNANKVKDKALLWRGIDLPTGDVMDSVIAKLKKGIKSAEKVVIGIEKVSHAESTNSTKDGLRIPIGIHGAQEVQYLTLGVGGSHHALIAGVAGSGKSSLLHTIILRALTQYSPEELVIYLVDFKRGVEFKIYADFELPSFKVVAIESEREFGYNILMNLEREQKIRADLFKKSHVDKIEEYRDATKKKLPRILVIMDEFHELFSNSNDEIGKKSAQIMERIVRQGRAFGVHMILASQSYSNITGIDRAVFDQMAVRIVLKCSKADANLLLDNGSNEIDLISIDDPGRAVYNSEAGNKEYNIHFRVAYIPPEKHRDMLGDIANKTKRFVDPQQPTRILLSNIEDNQYSIFSRFDKYDSATYRNTGRLYIGESLTIANSIAMDFTRSAYSNMLMIGTDTEKARSMFAFSILSLCINYWIVNRKPPQKPFIYLFNCKPLDDSYFKDSPKLLAEFLPEYIQYAACGDEADVQNILSQMYEDISEGASISQDKYFFVFGYQRAEELKSEVKLSQAEDIDSLFNIMSTSSNKPKSAPKDMFHAIVKDGPQKGIHTLLWQDSFNALYQDDKDIMSYFSMKIAFDMSPEEFSRFVSANDVSMMSENNAIYYNRARDNQNFRPYQSPDEDWLKGICEKLK